MDLVFYDGACGLCHGAVAFLARRDPEGRVFRFAPLGGATFRDRLPEAQGAGLPDSLALLTPEGDLLFRSGAVIRALRTLGGPWAILGRGLQLLPRPLRDGGYDLVARVRHRLFRKPEQACPTLPRDLQDRFLP